MLELASQKKDLARLERRVRNRTIVAWSLFCTTAFSLAFNFVGFRKSNGNSRNNRFIADESPLTDIAFQVWNNPVSSSSSSSSAAAAAAAAAAANNSILPTPDELFHPYDWDDENGETLVDFEALLAAMNETSTISIKLEGVTSGYLRWYGPIGGVVAMHMDKNHAAATATAASSPPSSNVIYPQVYFPINATNYVGATIIERVKWIKNIMKNALVQFMEMDSYERNTQFPSLVKALNETGSFPVLFWLDDQTGCNYKAYMYRGQPTTLPLLTFCSNIHCNHTFHIPDFESYQIARKESEEWDTQWSQWQLEFPRNESIPKAQWRGSCTGPPDIPREQKQRYVLDVLGRLSRPNLFDVSSQCDKDVPMDRRPPLDHLRFRAVLDVDGNAWTGRFARLLCSSTTVVVKILPKSIPFYWHTLIPGHHFLPATLEYNPDDSLQPLGNLTEVVRYAIADENQEQVQAIVKNAKEWCQTQMIFPTIHKRFLQTLDGYVELLDRSPIHNVQVVADQDGNAATTTTSAGDEEEENVVSWQTYWRQHADSYVGERSFPIHGGYVTDQPRERFRRKAVPLNIVTGRIP